MVQGTNVKIIKLLSINNKYLSKMEIFTEVPSPLGIQFYKKYVADVCYRGFVFLIKYSCFAVPAPTILIILIHLRFYLTCMPTLIVFYVAYSSTGFIFVLSSLYRNCLFLFLAASLLR